MVFRNPNERSPRSQSRQWFPGEMPPWPTYDAATQRYIKFGLLYATYFISLNTLNAEMLYILTTMRSRLQVDVRKFLSLGAGEAPSGERLLGKGRRWCNCR